MLISRFILNLRQAGEANKPPSRPSHIASLIFRIQETIVGNMGECLDHGFEGDAEEAHCEENSGLDEGGESGVVLERQSGVTRA